MLVRRRGAFVQGLQLTAFIGAVMMIGLAIMTLVLLRRVRPGSEPQRQPHLDAIRVGSPGS